MKFYIIAGEASGDLHGSNLMKGIYSRQPDAQIRFWGGRMMASVGGELVQDYREGAVMGFTDVIGKAGKLLANLKRCRLDILDWKPDVVILIDYPGFNFRIAEFAHKAGFKVFYYIAPKVWASREGRIRKIRRYVDKLFIVFPFEIPYFTRQKIDFVYKGNPLVDAVDGSKAMNTDRETFLSESGLPDKPYIAMLAGSRKGEISRMMPVLAEIATTLKSIPQYADYQFVVAGAPSRDSSDYEPFPDQVDSMKLVFGRTQEVVRFAEAAIVNSGTASLETVLLGTPQVVCWSTSKVTAFVARRILHVMDRIKFISLGNLCVDRLVFKELVQEDFTSEKVIAELRHILEDSSYRAGMMDGYAEIRSVLGGKGASDAVAQSMIENLGMELE
ncbi:MAG: lipid-A-disaccharide synthase [Bacteroidales bacterium]|nr:lipid-A-disaccharide synthase [Bacteroidales bacterium]